MPSTLACPQCSLDNTYPDGSNYVCADCGFEWPQAESVARDDDAEAAIKDANGNVLANGDAVVLIKDLKVKGSSITLKQGSKVKSIRLVDGDHEVDCKMDAGNFMLKARRGVFVAGEMLDWEAPTGGYLLTACFASGRAAGLGMIEWLQRKG